MADLKQNNRSESLWGMAVALDLEEEAEPRRSVVGLLIILLVEGASQ